MIYDRRVVPFRAWHYEWLTRHEATEGGTFRMPFAALLDLERQNSWTGVVNGDVVACAGTIQQWPGRHVAWAYIARGVRRHMPWVTTEVLRVLNGVRGRIEFTVRSDFAAGQRWAEKLGFHVETPCLKAFGPAGEDHVGFVRL